LLPEECGDQLRRAHAADRDARTTADNGGREAVASIRVARSIVEPGDDEPGAAAAAASRDRSYRVADAASRPNNDARSDVRRAGQLDELLNRELRDALQSLR
jgi:hypothetical protein